MSDTFTILEAGANEMAQYEVPMVLKPIVDSVVSARRNALVILGPKMGKRQMSRQWLEAVNRVNPTAAAQIKVTKNKLP